MKQLIQIKKLAKENEVEEYNIELANLSNNLVFEIILYFVYVITTLPLVSLIEIVKEIIKNKYINNLKDQFFPL